MFTHLDFDMISSVINVLVWVDLYVVAAAGVLSEWVRGDSSECECLSGLGFDTNG